MVASIREIMNKHFLSSSAITSNSTMTQIPSNMDIDIDMIREKPTLTSRASSRSSSISSNTLSIPYHQHMELNNDLPGIEPQEPIVLNCLMQEKQKI